MRHAERGIAFLRVVVGLWFLKGLFTKLGVTLALGVVPLPVASDRWIATMPVLLGRYAAENPFPWYRSFLLDVVVPEPAFAHLTALGEVAVGLSLTFGVLTGLGAALGALQVAGYGLAVQHMSPAQQGFHLMLLAMMLTFVWTRAGRTWGVDGWLASRAPVHRGARHRLALAGRGGRTTTIDLTRGSHDHTR